MIKLMRNLLPLLTCLALVASAGGIVDRNGLPPAPSNPFFDQAAANLQMTALEDDCFGSAVVATAGCNPVNNQTQLAALWNPLEDSTGTTVINGEMQRYAQAFDGTHHHFAPDALELTATNDVTVPGVTTTSPTAAVNYSRTVVLPTGFVAASGIKKGAVVGFGAESYANYHAIYTQSIDSATAGAVLTFTINNKNLFPVGVGQFFAYSVTSSGTPLTDAANLVAQINADTSMQAAQITAYALGNAPGSFAITFPKLPISGQPTEFGDTGNGSITWYTNTFVVTSGTATVRSRAQILGGINYIESITGDTIMLATPATLTTSSVLTFNPSRVFETAAAVAASNTFTGVGDVTGLTTLQVMQLGGQDSNLRAITAINTGTNSLTIEANVTVPKGFLIVAFPAYRATISSVAGNVLTFPATPVGIYPGMTFYNYNATNFNAYTVASTTATTVTLNATPSVIGAGNVVLFHQPITSGQIWTKGFWAPNATDNYTYIAFDWYVRWPDASAVPGWPAVWAYTSSRDPNSLGAGGNSEIDVCDDQNYYGNRIASNSYRAVVTSTFAVNSLQYRDTAFYNQSNAQGANLGTKNRRFTVLWSNTRLWFYVDNVLMYSVYATWPMAQRLQAAADLAMGSVSTTFNTSGFLPVDNSQFPMMFRVMRFRVLKSSN